MDLPVAVHAVVTQHMHKHRCLKQPESLQKANGAWSPLLFTWASAIVQDAVAADCLSSNDGAFLLDQLSKVRGNSAKQLE